MRISGWVCCFALLLPLPTIAAAAGPAHLVADLKTGSDPFDLNSGADFNSYLAVDGRVVFLGFLQPFGDCGLWVTSVDGGAERLADLCGGRMIDSNSKLRMDATAGSVAWFEDLSGVLWRTDGTGAGTYPLGVRVSRQFFDTPPVLGPDGKTLFFSGCAPTLRYPDDCEPWRSDGTLAGTRQIRDISPGPGSSQPTSFAPQRGRVLFIANGGLWSTDGTKAGTKALFRPPSRDVESFLVHGTDVYVLAGGDLWVFDTKTGAGRFLRGFPIEDGSHFNRIAGVVLREAGGRVFLYQFDLDHNLYTFWETDGTRAGTRALVPPPAFSLANGQLFSVGGGRLVFVAAVGQSSSRLWSVAPGTRQPVPLAGCPDGCPTIRVDIPTPAVVYHERLYFAGRDPGHGVELWSTDGTSQGTRRVADLCPGNCDGGPVQIRVALGRLVFADPKGDLWASDGTAAGTVRLAATGVLPSPYIPLDFAALGGRLVFTALDPASGRQPFASDLTPAGTDVLARIGGLLAASSRPLGLTAAGGRAVFTACGDSAAGLWGSDGTPAGTVLLPGTERPCEANPDFDIFRSAGGLAYFDFDGQLWRTDGTPGGTAPILSQTASFKAPLGGRLLFVTDPADNEPSPEGRDFTFWTTDGTPQGTRQELTRRFTSGPDRFYVTTAGGVVYFLATAPESGYGLWRTDGTAAGTFPLLGGLLQNDGRPPQVASLGGKAYFLAWARESAGYELWASDGTVAGTVPVFPDLAGRRPFSPYGLTAFRDALYFFGQPANDRGWGLWRSDGTAAGTRLLRALERPAGDPFASEFYPSALTPVGDQLFFAANVAGSGPELWKTDGTRAGTVLVKDIAPGPASSRPRELTAAGGRLYFTATDGVHGDELWQSDGTAAGTTLVQDILPGPASSSPQDLTAAGGTLYFTADDGEHGRELWALPLP
jgi:ELWxxDGT repeat protein